MPRAAVSGSLAAARTVASQRRAVCAYALFALLAGCSSDPDEPGQNRDPDAASDDDAGPDSGDSGGTLTGAMDGAVEDAGTDAGACVPGDEEHCYTGPDGTDGVGACTAGTRACLADSSGFGPCEGEVVPAVDDCTNDVDDDCNGVVDDGAPDGDDCVCIPGTQEPCYTGPDGTEGVGACAAGEQTCLADGTGFGACEGETVPVLAACASADVDCNGTSDDVQDLDGDGYALCDDDCCDSAAHGCDDPESINPGAFDYAADGIDDDCNGTADDATTVCDDALVSNTSDSVDHARAIDLCQVTTAAPPQSDRRWGVLSATFTLADGTGTPAAAQRAVRTDFGAIQPEHGTRLAVLSTGNAADTADTNPSFVAYEPGATHDTESGFPSDWFAANGSTLPQTPACPAISATEARDSAMLTFTVRVPTNARAFALRAYFLSSEFPEWVCSPFNDFFVALLGSSHDGTPQNPADDNIAVYTTPGGTRYPVGSNLAYGNTGLFTACTNGPTGCADSSVASTISTCTSSADLVGTGFDAADTLQPCSMSSDQIGGGTGWLQLAGNVEPGETITLRLAIWDTGDYSQDSLVLLDDFTWFPAPVDPGATQP